MGAQLLLPVGASIKFEMIPALDKSSIPSLAALLGCMMATCRLPRIFHGFGLPEILICLLVISPFITSELNTDPIRIEMIDLPGSSHYDGGSAVIAQLLFVLPFFLGRQLLRNAEDTEEVMRVLVAAGLFYSLPVLFEIRMSPQLHTWIYGYFPHSFGQQVRDGGFRPVVFLGHGLLVAFFVMTTVVAAAALWRTESRVHRLPAGAITAYLSAVLVLCKTLSAALYGAVLAILVRLTGPRLQVRIALLLVIVTLLYPTLRTIDLFPTRALLEFATSFSADRAQSLEFRLNNEDQLLERAWQRIMFGWGRFGRNRVYDPETGKDLSVTDGRWIITLGVFGFAGFLAEFGLLALPVWRAASALKFTESLREQIFLSALALIVAISLVDLLPNASLSPWTWLLAGVLLGRTEALRADALAPRTPVR